MNSSKEQRKEYTKPKLTVHGEVSEITLATGDTPTFTDGYWDDDGNLYPGDKGSITG